MKMQSIASLLGVAIGLLASPAFSQSKMTVAYIPSVDFVPLFVAQDEGYFTKRGLDVTLQMIPVAANMPAALTSHSIDIGVGTMPPLLLATENGLEFSVVAGYTRNLASDPQTSLLVRKGFDYKNPADLKGKRVGTPGFMSSFDIHFRKWLTLKNIDPKDVNFIETKFNQMGDQMKGGIVDAAIVIEPFRGEAVRNGSGDRAADFLGEVTKDDAGAFWMSNRDWAVAHPKERAAFRAALEEGVETVSRDHAMAEATMKKYLKFTAPVAGDWSFDLTPADIQFYEDMMLEFGLLKQKIDVTTLIAK
jgi:NitT/TauT family transport system substrate-binding protein